MTSQMYDTVKKKDTQNSNDTPKWVILFRTLAVIIAALSFWYAQYETFLEFNWHERVKVVQASIICFWTVGPPIWFTVEFWARAGGMEREEFARFKYAQQLGSRVWVTMIAVLAFLYFGKALVK